MKEQRNMLQIEQDEYPESDLTGAEISDLSHRELKLMVLKMLTTWQSENFNTEIKNIFKTAKQRSQN